MKLSPTIKDRMMQDAINRFTSNRLADQVNLHLYDEVLEAGQALKAGPREVLLPQRTALVFADLKPIYNWAHPCQYLLYSPDTGTLLDRIDATFPPMIFFTDMDMIDTFHAPVRPSNMLAARKTSIRPIRPITNALIRAPGNRFAVLFSGMSENRHVNDLEFLYRTLIDIYDFDPANIFVLNHDGTINYFGWPKPVGNWPGDDTAYRMVVNGQGTQADFENTIDTLAGRIGPGDFLLIHTNNHGAGPGDFENATESCLCGYGVTNWTPYYATDFATKLATLPQFEVLAVMLEQCRSGGFLDPIVQRSPAKWMHVAAAVEADDYSAGGADFDPFALDWIAAVTGQYPDGTGLSQVADTNSDGRLSVAEAYAYADAVNDQGDTPVVTENVPQCGSYIFLGLPAHDLYIRDNLEDRGREPLIGGGISASPDIIVYNQELLDPEVTLCAPAAQDRVDLGEAVEFGQDNYIYLRVTNRGTQPSAGSAKLYWTKATTLPTPTSWHLIGEAAIPAVAPNEMKAVGPIVWQSEDIPKLGKSACFVALVNSGSDPAPDPATIHTISDYHHFIRESNNATWKNFEVVDMFKGGAFNFDFHIQGWRRTALHSDLNIDLTALPDTAEVYLRILGRLSKDAGLDGLELIEESAHYQRFKVTSERVSRLLGMALPPSDNSQATLEFVLPEALDDGAYRISVQQVVDGVEMGRLTKVFVVGPHPFIANSNTGEVHIPGCDWIRLMTPTHQVAYRTVERALKHGYNGCRYCLPEYNTDL